jgi:hypothetical protein
VFFEYLLYQRPGHDLRPFQPEGTTHPIKSAVEMVAGSL